MLGLVESESFEEGFSIAQDVVDIALGKGAEDVAVIYKEDVGRHLRFSQNKADIANTWLYKRISVCIGKEKRILVVETEDLQLESLKRFIEGSVDSMKYLPPRPVYASMPEGPFEYPLVQDLYDDRILEAEDELVDMAKTAIDSALSEGAERVAGVVKSRAGYSCLVTTGGVNICSRDSQVYLEIRAFANEEATGHGTTCSRSLSGLDPKRAGMEAGRDAMLAKNHTKGEPGKYNVIFGRSALGNLVGIFGHMASALYILMQMSPYVDKIDQKIASEKVTLIDDPLMSAGYGSRVHDDEGLPTKRNVIIEEGVLKTYLHNRLTAKAFNTNSTANAGWIIPKPWYLILKPGETKDEELIEEMKEGLIVKNATYLRFQNYRTGDFSAVIRDGVFRVKNGEIIEEVRGLRLSDNLLNLLSNVYQVSREAIPVFHWWMEWEVPVVTPLMAVHNVGFTSAIL